MRDRKPPGLLRRHRDAGLFVDLSLGRGLAGDFLRTEDEVSTSLNHADRPKETTSVVMVRLARVHIA
jgi:hypothetical protein